MEAAKDTVSPLRRRSDSGGPLPLEQLAQQSRVSRLARDYRVPCAGGRNCCTPTGGTTIATNEMNNLRVADRQVAVAIVVENPLCSSQAVAKQCDAVDKRVPDDGRHVVEIVLRAGRLHLRRNRCEFGHDDASHLLGLKSKTDEQLQREATCIPKRNHGRVDIVMHASLRDNERHAADAEEIGQRPNTDIVQYVSVAAVCATYGSGDRSDHNLPGSSANDHSIEIPLSGVLER